MLGLHIWLPGRFSLWFWPGSFPSLRSLARGVPLSPLCWLYPLSLALDSVELRDPIQNLLSTSVIFIDHLSILNTFFFLQKKDEFLLFQLCALVGGAH